MESNKQDIQLFSKLLKRYGFIKNESDLQDSMVATSQSTLKAENDLIIRDTLYLAGTILEENLKEHYYLAAIPCGFLNSATAVLLIARDGHIARINSFMRNKSGNTALAEKAIQIFQKNLSKN